MRKHFLLFDKITKKGVFDVKELLLAIKKREQGETQDARDLLLSLVKEYPENPEVLYQTAWVHDALGLEIEAVPYYEKALQNGLDGEDRKGAFLGLGSTYRTIGEYDQARRTLEQGMKEFPEAAELAVFCSMVMYNQHEYEGAMTLLLTAVAETSNHEGIQAYKKAILFYSDKLNEVWK
ncbi:tetratricopeptide repeat protein [Priestia koreensis]|uniref:tetratricopeptide repeat protein n=1 Tax=Priestia koreensis TaxID=284581 RepID=UPI00316AD571